ncbi:DNA-binding response regulator [Sphingobium amiense]|uniref:DNA-binding response regulator n=1 Tax=Sphingobium amiense TaxID=135719 RepID=A0A494W9Y1_9SPHN|nr:response regulator transcription factor [Sphingobium amiense]BBD97212.1 DNA-binding response regulator [Sphingobium amiense]
MRILLIEDNCDVGEGIVESVERMGHSIDWARSGDVGDEWLVSNSYQLVLLDIMLPGMDGMKLLRRLRERRSDVPVLILSARAGTDDRIDMLDLGADDYLVKPFDFRELQARVRSLLRRHTGERSNNLRCGRLVYDRVARLAKVDDRILALSRRELSLLEIFLARKTQVFSKAQLLDQLFGYNSEPTENNIEVLIARLRRKLAGTDVEITTQRGVGYRIVES